MDRHSSTARMGGRWGRAAEALAVASSCHLSKVREHDTNVSRTAVFPFSSGCWGCIWMMNSRYCCIYKERCGKCIGRRQLTHQEASSGVASVSTIAPHKLWHHISLTRSRFLNRGCERFEMSWKASSDLSSYACNRMLYMGHCGCPLATGQSSCC